jgi:exosortase/archaeosortase family protein
MVWYQKMFIDKYSVHIKGVLWAISVLVTLSIFGNVVHNFSDILNVQLLRQDGFYSWVVLLLCVLWIWIKRSEIDISNAKVDARWLCLGVGLFIPALVLLNYLSVSIASLPLKIFAISLVAVSSFCIFFGRASKVPFMLLIIYGIAVGFPLFIETLFSSSFSMVTALVSTSTLRFFGVPVSLVGVKVSLTSLNGSDIVTMVDARCSGSDSIAIFFAIFGLMLMDRKPKNLVVLGLFILGLAGTFIQNFIRLLLLFAAGYYYGSDSLWLVHDYASYILFPIWFLAFSLIYVRYTNGNKNNSYNNAQEFE